MKIPTYAKAIVGAVVAGLAPVASAAATDPSGVTSSTGVASLVAAVVGGVLTYFVPNAKAEGDTSVSGLVVTVKTDAGKFLDAFLAGVPALVKASAEAALAPQAAPAEPATPAAAAAPPAQA